jgi:hypothetical protein
MNPTTTSSGVPAKDIDQARHLKTGVIEFTDGHAEARHKSQINLFLPADGDVLDQYIPAFLGPERHAVVRKTNGEASVILQSRRGIGQLNAQFGRAIVIKFARDVNLAAHNNYSRPRAPLARIDFVKRQTLYLVALNQSDADDARQLRRGKAGVC